MSFFISLTNEKGENFNYYNSSFSYGIGKQFFENENEALAEFKKVATKKFLRKDRFSNQLELTVILWTFDKLIKKFRPLQIKNIKNV